MPGYFSAGVIPDETKALSLLAPANAVAGLLPGGGLLPTPNPLSQVGLLVGRMKGTHCWVLTSSQLVGWCVSRQTHWCAGVEAQSVLFGHLYGWCCCSTLIQFLPEG